MNVPEWLQCRIQTPSLLYFLNCSYFHPSSCTSGGWSSSLCSHNLQVIGNIMMISYFSPPKYLSLNSPSKIVSHKLLCLILSIISYSKAQNCGDFVRMIYLVTPNKREILILVNKRINGIGRSLKERNKKFAKGLILSCMEPLFIT